MYFILICLVVLGGFSTFAVQLLTNKLQDYEKTTFSPLNACLHIWHS